MKSIKGKNLMKIAEVVKESGAPVSTIHYYVKEGLITPPVKTSPNMAYYEPGCVEEIKLIQELQSKNYLPLFAIKLIIKAKREGQAEGHIGEMQDFMAEIFRPLDSGTAPKEVTLKEIASASALPEATIKSLVKKGIINRSGGTFFNDIDIQTAKAVKKLLDFGVKLSYLDILRKQIQTIRDEAREMHGIFHQLPNHEEIPIREMLKTVGELKRSLEMGVYREEAGHFHDQAKERKQ